MARFFINKDVPQSPFVEELRSVYNVSTEVVSAYKLKTGMRYNDWNKETLQLFRVKADATSDSEPDMLYFLYHSQFVVGPYVDLYPYISSTEEMLDGLVSSNNFSFPRYLVSWPHIMMHSRQLTATIEVPGVGALPNAVPLKDFSEQIPQDHFQYESLSNVIDTSCNVQQYASLLSRTRTRASQWMIRSAAPLTNPNKPTKATIEDLLTTTAIIPHPTHAWYIEVEWSSKTYWQAIIWVRGVIQLHESEPTLIWTPRKRQYQTRIFHPALWLSLHNASPWPHTAYSIFAFPALAIPKSYAISDTPPAEFIEQVTNLSNEFMLLLRKYTVDLDRKKLLQIHASHQKEYQQLRTQWFNINKSIKETQQVLASQQYTLTVKYKLIHSLRKLLDRHTHTLIQLLLQYTDDIEAYKEFNQEDLATKLQTYENTLEKSSHALQQAHILASDEYKTLLRQSKQLREKLKETISEKQTQDAALLQLKQENDKLNAELEGIEKLYEQQTESFRKLKAQYREADSTRTAWEKDLTRLQARLQTSKTQVASLQQTLKAKEQEIVDNTKNLQIQNAAIQALKTRIREQDTEKAKLQDELIREKKKVETLTEQITSHKLKEQTQADAISKLEDAAQKLKKQTETQLSDLQTQLSLAEKQVLDLQQTLTTKEQQIADNTKDLQKQSAAVQQLQTIIQQQTAEIQDLQNKFSRKSEKIVRVQKKARELREQIGRQDVTLKTQTDTIKKLEAAVQKLEQTQTKLQLEIKGNEDTITVWVQETERKAKEVQDLKQKLQASERKLQEAEQTIQQQNTRIQALMTELAEITEHATQVELKNRDLEQQITQLTSERDQLKQQVEALVDSYAALKEQTRHIAMEYLEWAKHARDPVCVDMALSHASPTFRPFTTSAMSRPTTDELMPFLRFVDAASVNLEVLKENNLQPELRAGAFMKYVVAQTENTHMAIYVNPTKGFPIFNHLPGKSDGIFEQHGISDMLPWKTSQRRRPTIIAWKDVASYRYNDTLYPEGHYVYSLSKGNTSSMPFMPVHGFIIVSDNEPYGMGGVFVYNLKRALQKDGLIQLSAKLPTSDLTLYCRQSGTDESSIVLEFLQLEPLRSYT